MLVLRVALRASLHVLPDWLPPLFAPAQVDISVRFGAATIRGLRRWPPSTTERYCLRKNQSGNVYNKPKRSKPEQAPSPGRHWYFTVTLLYQSSQWRLRTKLCPERGEP